GPICKDPAQNPQAMLFDRLDKESTMQKNMQMAKAPGSRLNSDFWKYWTGQTISNLGSSVTLFALPLLVYKLTGSAINLGISGAADFLPYLLFGLILGAWTDRVDRKRMMIFTDIARAMIVATIPLLAVLGAPCLVDLCSGLRSLDADHLL